VSRILEIEGATINEECCRNCKWWDAPPPPYTNGDCKFPVPLCVSHAMKAGTNDVQTGCPCFEHVSETDADSQRLARIAEILGPYLTPIIAAHEKFGYSTNGVPLSLTEARELQQQLLGKG